MSDLPPELHAEYEKWTVAVPYEKVDGLMDSNLPLYSKWMALRSMITKNDFDNIEDEPYPPEVYKVDHAIWEQKNALKGTDVADAVQQYAGVAQEILNQ